LCPACSTPYETLYAIRKKQTKALIMYAEIYTMNLQTSALWIVHTSLPQASLCRLCGMETTSLNQNYVPVFSRRSMRNTYAHVLCILLCTESRYAQLCSSFLMCIYTYIHMLLYFQWIATHTDVYCYMLYTCATTHVCTHISQSANRQTYRKIDRHTQMRKHMNDHVCMYVYV